MPDIINSSFDPRLPFPLDVREQVQNMNALYAIPNTSRWEGMVVYVKGAQIPYILKGGIDNSFWVPFQFNGGGGILPNGIVVYGEAQQSGNNILLNDDWVWRIDQVDYQSSDDVIAITPAASGNVRVDIIVGDNLGNFVKVEGTEVASPGPAIEPNIPADTVPLLRVEVNDTGITAIEEFINSAFVRFDIDDQGLTPTYRQNARTNIQAVSKDTDDTRTGSLTQTGDLILEGDVRQRRLGSTQPFTGSLALRQLVTFANAVQSGLVDYIITDDGTVTYTMRNRGDRVFNAFSIADYVYRFQYGGVDSLVRVSNSGGTNNDVNDSWKFFDRVTADNRSSITQELTRRDELYLTYPVTIGGAGKLNDVALADGVGEIKFGADVTEVSGIDANGDTKELLIWSDNPDGITLPAEDVLSIAANRFHREVNIPYQTWVKIVYDGDLARWVNGNTGELQEVDDRYFEVTSDVLTLKYILPDIAALEAFVRGSAVIAEVSDPLRGGKFNYVDEADFPGTADNGISFLAQDGGYWVRDFDGDVNIRWYQVVADGVTNDTIAINSAAAALTDNSNLIFPKGDYVLDSLILDGFTGIGVIGDNAILRQSEQLVDDPDTGRSTIEILNSDFVSVKGFRLYGQQLNPIYGTNSTQRGIYFNTVTNSKIENCFAYEFHESYRIQSCEGVELEYCKSDKTRTSYLITDSSNCYVDKCISYDAHYSPNSLTRKSQGYAFLSDNNNVVEFNNCISYRSGSDCFRAQNETDNEIDTFYNNCISVSPARDSFKSTTKGVFFNSCKSYNLRDPSYFNGAAGSFTEAYGDISYGIYIDSLYTKVSNCEVKFNYSDLCCGLRTLSGDTYIEDSEFEGGFEYTGGAIKSNSDNIKVTNTKVKNTALNIAGLLQLSSNSIVTNCELYGGTDTIQLLNDHKNEILNNRIENSGRYGIFMGTTTLETFIDGNHIINCNQQDLVSVGGILIDSNNITLGINIIEDNQVTKTTKNSVFIRSGITGLFLGKIIERGGSFGVDRNNDASTDTLQEEYENFYGDRVFYNNSEVKGLFNSTGDYIIENSVFKSSKPKGATFYTGSAADSGAFKIKLPIDVFLVSTISFDVNIYNIIPNRSIKFRISGRLSEVSSIWNYTAVTNVINDIESNFTVRFGKDATDAPCLWIGEIDTDWLESNIDITNLSVSRSPILSSIWAENWEISLVTAFDTVQVTKTNNLPIGKSFSGTTANRPSLTGLPIGFSYFDTTLGIPIWAKNATDWVDATGTTV